MWGRTSVFVPIIQTFLFIRGADTLVRPDDGDYEMEVVRHTDEQVTFNVGEFAFQLPIPSVNHPPGVVESHLSIDDLPEDAFAVLRAQGDEICAVFGIIISRQADRPPTVDIRVVFHNSPRKARSSSDPKTASRPMRRIIQP